MYNSSAYVSLVSLRCHINEWLFLLDESAVIRMDFHFSEKPIEIENIMEFVKKRALKSLLFLFYI